MSDLDERLAKAKAERAAIQAAREAREVDAAALAAVEAEELALRDDRAIAAAELEHGAAKIAIVRTLVGCVIVKRPHHLIYKKFQETSETKIADLEKLVRSCLVHPDVGALERIIEEQPAAILQAADAVCQLAGVRAREVAGK